MYQLFSTQTGAGKNPVLFFHGLWGGGNYFRRLDLSKLELGPLYFPDQLGFGKSPKPNIEYTPQVHIEAIAQSVPHQKYTIVGNSFGCVLAVYFAMLHPELVDRIILISPVLHKDRAEAKQYLSSKLIPKLTISHPWAASLLCHTLCKTRMLEIVAPFIQKTNKRVYLQGCTKHTWHSYYSTFMNCFLNEPSLPMIQEISEKIPTLILSSQTDNYVNPKTIQLLSAKKLTKQFISNASHNLFFEQTDECLTIIEKWIRLN